MEAGVPKNERKLCQKLKKIDKIVPKCVMGDRVTMGHSALGFLLPCCWCDGKAYQSKELLSKEHEALYSEHLHIR